MSTEDGIEGYRLVTFNEEGYQDIATYLTLREARAYRAGFSAGSSYYGGGGTAYILEDPEEARLMHEDEKKREVTRALADVAFRCPNWLSGPV